MPKGPRRRPVVDRFWPKVRKTDGCWEWTGAKAEHGYGAVYVPPNGTPRAAAHRVAWELTFGPIPDGLGVLHHCDNPPCVRPDHLFLGTRADNVADMVAKGRHRGARNQWGERHPSHKLTDAQVREIRRLVASGVTQRACAAAFGIHFVTVNKVVNRLTWPHVV